VICAYCGEAIVGEAETIPHVESGRDVELRHYHRECRTRMIMGGLNHLMGRCTCSGGTEPPDPPELTPRQAALAACNYLAAGFMRRPT